MARQHFHTFPTFSEKNQHGVWIHVHDRLNKYLHDNPNLEVKKVRTIQTQKIGGTEAMLLVEFEDYSPLPR